MPQRRLGNSAVTPKLSLPKPWWLDGDEECPHCGQTYVFELEFRCVECDTPGCHHCTAVHAEGHLICLSCNDDSSTERVQHG